LPPFREKLISSRKTRDKEVAAALDLSMRIATSMGRSLEDVTKQQVYILAAATVTRTEAVLLHHKIVLPSDWLRAQPLLTGESLFGTVAAKTKPLLQEHQDRLKDEAVISTNRRSRTV
jgi:hypothetical protein